jgi:hypothetical protein
VRHLTRGNKGLAPPSFLEPGPDRISPPTRASTVYHGPGFETASPEASACLYVKSSRLSWEFIAPRYRRGCPSVAAWGAMVGEASFTRIPAFEDRYRSSVPSSDGVTLGPESTRSAAPGTVPG